MPLKSYMNLFPFAELALAPAGWEGSGYADKKPSVAAPVVESGTDSTGGLNTCQQ